MCIFPLHFLDQNMLSELHSFSRFLEHFCVRKIWNVCSEKSSYVMTADALVSGDHYLFGLSTSYT